jgi:hypothetical protein
MPMGGAGLNVLNITMRFKNAHVKTPPKVRKA